MFKKCIVNWTLMGIFQQFLNLFHVKLPHDNHSTQFLMKLHLFSMELFWHIKVSAWHKFSSCIFHPKLLSRVSKVRFRCIPFWGRSHPNITLSRSIPCTLSDFLGLPAVSSSSRKTSSLRAGTRDQADQHPRQRYNWLGYNCPGLPVNRIALYNITSITGS